MKLNEAFPSKWLKADEFEDADALVTIKSWDLEEFKANNKTEKKIILRFRELERGLVCNKTNAAQIAKLYGDDLDDWIGKRITLCSMEVPFGADMVMSIRVRGKKPADAAKSKPAPAVVTEEDEDLPF